MKSKLIGIVLSASLIFLAEQSVQARGFGGFHGGGGGFHAGGFSGGGFSGGGARGGFSGGGFSGGGARGGGFDAGGFSSGGFRSGGFDAGGARSGGFDAGGNRAGGFDAGGARAGGFDAGGARAGGFDGGGARAGGFDAGGARAGGFDAGGVRAGGFRANGVSAGHLGLATDGGFGRAWTGASASHFFAASNRTVAVSHSVYAARGATVRNSFNNYGVFGRDWYGTHPGAWACASWTAGRCWTAATWASVGAWCGYPATVQPVYFDYGNNITYQGDQVYYGDQPVATADQYYQQAQTLAQAAPPTGAPSADDWMPLGVFSLVQGSQTNSNTVFQLAISKTQAIAGNYSDVFAGTTLPIHGSVDKKSQRAAWSVGDNKTTVYETGISDLTKEEVPVLVHFNKDDTQQWMLVRLKQPAAADGK